MSENSYSLKFTPKASEDIEQIYSYISGKLFAEIAADDLLTIAYYKLWKQQHSRLSSNEIGVSLAFRFRFALSQIIGLKSAKALLKSRAFARYFLIL